MIELKRILLPTDFSEQSLAAKGYACALAEQFGAELHLLNVVHDLASEVPEFGMGLAFPGFVENLPGRMEDLEREAIGRIAKVLDAAWEQGRRVVLATKRGTPFLEILRYAREHEIDLIVLGTHGRSGLAHALMGSVAERVVRKATCPVLTVRPSGHQFRMP